MARPKNQHPSPYIRLKGGKWMPGWEWQGKSYEFSTGFAKDGSCSYPGADDGEDTGAR